MFGAHFSLNTRYINFFASIRQQVNNKTAGLQPSERWKRKKKTIQMKKRSEKRKHCALAVVMRSQKKISPAANPLPGGAGPLQFNQLETVAILAPRDQVWWRSTHAISSYRGNRHRPLSQTHRQDRLQYTAPQL